MLSNLFINSFNVIHPLLFTSTSSIIAWASARDKTLPKLLSELARSSADKSPSRSASKISNAVRQSLDISLFSCIAFAFSG